jgi:hypothetical protein
LILDLLGFFGNSSTDKKEEAVKSTFKDSCKIEKLENTSENEMENQMEKQMENQMDNQLEKQIENQVIENNANVITNSISEFKPADLDTSLQSDSNLTADEDYPIKRTTSKGIGVSGLKGKFNLQKLIQHRQQT